MSVSEIFLHAAAAILLFCLVAHHPRVARRAGRGGVALVIVGALLPLADLLLFFSRSADRIGFLTQAPLFSGLFFGLGLIAVAATLAGFVFTPATGLRVLTFAGAGFLLHTALAFLTPGGAPLWQPFSPARAGLPIFEPGHPLLLALLAVALVGLESLGRWRGLWFAVCLGLLGLYFSVGVGQYALIAYRAGDWGGGSAAVSVEPANGWLTRWMVTETQGPRYTLVKTGVTAGKLPPGDSLERWNNEPLLVRLLGDPIVRHFYYRVFRHPVVHTSTTGAQTTLVMQELEPGHLFREGRAFYLELDHEAQTRIYRVSGFE